MEEPGGLGGNPSDTAVTIEVTTMVGVSGGSTLVSPIYGTLSLYATDEAWWCEAVLDVVGV